VRIDGPVWRFGDDINTDLILPIPVIPLPVADRPQHMFRANRPGWAAQVQPGEILVAGRNFGMGSNRPAAQVMRDLGLGCLLAESINGLFFRSCVNYAFPALEVPGVHDAFEEGDVAEVEFEAALVRNTRTGAELRGSPWPDMALRVLAAGGLIQQLDSAGLLQPPDWRPAT
jgi:3-isopropylmalate/(R)-2-methylmalate dehydratase small subunit